MKLELTAGACLGCYGVRADYSYATDIIKTLRQASVAGTTRSDLQQQQRRVTHCNFGDVNRS
jgi:hypothetical protein